MPRYINWLDSGIHNPKVGSSSLPLGTEMALQPNRKRQQTQNLFSASSNLARATRYFFFEDSAKLIIFRLLNQIIEIKKDVRLNLTSTSLVRIQQRLPFYLIFQPSGKAQTSQVCSQHRTVRHFLLLSYKKIGYNVCMPERQSLQTGDLRTYRSS